MKTVWHWIEINFFKFQNLKICKQKVNSLKKPIIGKVFFNHIGTHGASKFIEYYWFLINNYEMHNILSDFWKKQKVTRDMTKKVRKKKKNKK